MQNNELIEELISGAAAEDGVGVMQDIYQAGVMLAAVDRLNAQDALISAMKILLQEVVDESISLEYSEGGDFLVDKAVIEKIESFLS